MSRLSDAELSADIQKMLKTRDFDDALKARCQAVLAKTPDPTGPHFIEVGLLLHNFMVANPGHFGITLKG